MTSDERRDLAQEAAELAEAVVKLNEDMAGQVVELAKVVQRDRRLVRGLLISVILDVILSVAIAIIAITATNAKSQAEQNHTNAVLTCTAANQSRVAQIQLWEYVLALSGDAPTPAQAERVRKFRIYLGQLFAPRDCSDPGKPVTIPTAPPT